MSPDWKARFQVPDVQVRDAAQQFEEARRILSSQQPLSGVLLAQKNAAAVAIELHLKSLSAKRIFTPVADDPEISLVTASPVRGHGLVSLWDAADEDARRAIDDRFEQESKSWARASLRELLGQFEGVFAASRYPFEQGTDISAFRLSELMLLSEFLSRAIRELPIREWIEFE